MNEYLTVKQAAKYIKKSPSTVRRLIRGKQIKAMKLAGKYGVYLINRSDMMEYMMGKMSTQIAKASDK